MEFLSIIIIVLVIIAILITEIEKHNTKKEMLVSFSDLYENGEYFKAITILEKLFINVEPELLFEQNELEYRDFEKIAYCYFRTNRYQVAIDFYDYLLFCNENNNKIFYNRAIAKYKLNSNDTIDLEEIYNKEQPFILLNKTMYFKFDDKEQKKAIQAFEKNEKTSKSKKIFGTHRLYI